MADGGGPASVAERKDRAGRIEGITNLVTCQRALAKISGEIHKTRHNFAEYGIELEPEKVNHLLEARRIVLDAADHLHAVAAELVGELRRD